ncbi:putative inorganic carbon transporter subunit DabA [Thiohalomonas denitrificans]|uniref:putative inorganic carbon transporter subunit DabA n=1 Tax=Thiohalomonas denitrificans TaxID=415747 RepID=UPI0026EA28E8|nr:putative inorganic carbon transporter subunit DabA [Thiohalomonas denitrificans]
MSGTTASHRQPGDNPSADMHTRLEALIAHLEHVLPAQAPIREFVHHNTLHGFAHLPFREALSEARRLTGARGYLPNETFRELYRSGRITRTDLEAVIAEASAGETELDAEAVLIECAARPVRCRDVLVAGLLYPFRPVTACQLNWQIEELNAFTTCQSDLAPAAASLGHDRQAPRRDRAGPN